MGCAAITSGCFLLVRLLHVSCFVVSLFGPFRRLTAAVAVCQATFLFWLVMIKAASFLRAGFCLLLYGFVFQMPPRRSTRSKRPSIQALESLVVSSPRRRRTAADTSEPAPPVPPVPAAEPVIPAAVSAFPPVLFAQLVQQVAAEDTKQLQPATPSSAVQEPRVASPTSAALPSLTGITALQQLTTEVPVINSSAVDQVVQSVPVGNAAAVDHVAQVV